MHLSLSVHQRYSSTQSVENTLYILRGVRMILKKAEHITEIEKLNLEAFPAEEQIPVCDLVRMAQQDNYAVLAAYEEERFIGFAFLAVNKPSVYLFLLAVSAPLRSKGYGGKIVQSVCRFYPGCQLVVDIQRTDVPCDNLPQRLKRREFYLRSGFHPTNRYLQFNGMDFELLCSSPTFNERAFKGVLENMQANGFLLQVR